MSDPESEVADRVAHRGLEAAEGERRVEPGAGQWKPGWVARRSDPLDRRPSRIFQTKQTRNLVERLAGGVIAGGGKPFGDAVLTEQDALGVPSAHQQRQVRGLELAVREPRAVHVSGQVRHPNDRHAAGDGGARRVHGADDQASGQPRPPRHGDRVDGIPAAG